MLAQFDVQNMMDLFFTRKSEINRARDQPVLIYTHKCMFFSRTKENKASLVCIGGMSFRFVLPLYYFLFLVIIMLASVLREGRDVGWGRRCVSYETQQSHHTHTHIIAPTVGSYVIKTEAYINPCLSPPHTLTQDAKTTNNT